MKNISAIAIAIWLTGLNFAEGQIVNIESARMHSDTVGWKGGIGLGFSLTQNTAKIFGFDADAFLQYKTSSDMGVWFIMGNYNRLKIGDKESISNHYLHLRYNRKVNEWLRWEFFTQYLNNDITQIKLRYLAGTGARFRLIKHEFFRLYAGISAMYEHEQELTSPKVTHNDLRSSNYVSFTWLPRPNITLVSTTYYQPLYRKLSDFRFLNQASFTVKATPRFGMTLKWNYLHDKFPAGVAPRTTYNFSTGFEYDF